jgi:hypothetical protein
MKKTTKKAAQKTWDTHVYLAEADRRACEAIANREARSLTGQITVFIRQGIALATK